MVKLFLLAAKSLISSAGYRVKRAAKKPVKPLFINFPVTYMCNARCVMCDIWKKYGDEKVSKKTQQDELGVEDITRFLKVNRDFLSDLRNIGFTGGEPFLRKDFVEIVRAVSEELPWVDVGAQTNGLLPELVGVKLKKILEFKPNFKLAVSLDGVGKMHDEVRGQKGAYGKAMETIEYAKSLGITGITCGMTLTVRNFDRVGEVAARVESLGCEFSCFLPEISEYFGNSENQSRLSDEQLKVVAEELRDFDYHYFMDNLRSRVSEKTKRTLPCYSGYTSYVIDPYGEVLPCILRGESFGNIKGASLKEIVDSEKAWKLRGKLESCTCWCQCEVSSSAVVAPFDVLKWFLMSRNKKAIIDSMNKKRLEKRL